MTSTEPFNYGKQRALPGASAKLKHSIHPAQRYAGTDPLEKAGRGRMGVGWRLVNVTLLETGGTEDWKERPEGV